ncbi:MAG: hypothetical protein JJT94_11175 [Bernardetiaceae bacterium]|nr:hypothetical protein [Bernardetiaceae bacterium]
MTIDKVAFEQMLKQKYISVQQHKEADIFIYNYTASTQYDKVWNPITLQARGLICDAEGRVLARPFPKFFNLGELSVAEIPDENFEVYEKMDGSLGILYWLKGKPQIATRGSFTSEQALRGTAILYQKYADAIAHLNPDYTYLFEIIYPENRIVVDYGNLEMLTLLAVVDTQTGRELELPNIGFPLVKKYADAQDLKYLASLDAENREGFVIRFESGFRLKIKFETYTRLHRVLTGLSSTRIWEMMSVGEDIAPFLSQVPDEFYTWVKRTQTELKAQYETIEAQAKADFKVLETRKETALYFQTCAYPAIMFQMLDGKDYSHTIWKMIKPKFEKAFAQEENTTPDKT